MVACLCCLLCACRSDADLNAAERTSDAGGSVIDAAAPSGPLLTDAAAAAPSEPVVSDAGEAATGSISPGRRGTPLNDARLCPCTPPFVCEDGRCVCAPRFDCAYGECGDVPDGCGGVRHCGSCGPALQPTPSTQVPPLDGGQVTCIPTQCPEQSCGVIADGCGETVNCGKCPGTLACGLKHANRCGTESVCPMNHVCALVELFGAQVGASPKGVLVLLYADKPSADIALPSQVLAKKLTRLPPESGGITVSEVAPGVQDQRELVKVSVDIGDWPKLSGYFIVVLSHSLDPQPELGDVIAYQRHSGPLTVSPGGVYDLGALPGRYFAPEPDDRDRPGNEGAHVVECAGPCPFKCCQRFQEQPTWASRICAESCDDAALLHVSCDGPEDCAVGQVCCQTGDPVTGRSRADCTSATCTTSLAVTGTTFRLCHSDSHCLSGEFCSPTGAFEACSL